MFNHSFFNKPMENANDLPILKRTLKYMTKKSLKYFFFKILLTIGYFTGIIVCSF